MTREKQILDNFVTVVKGNLNAAIRKFDGGQNRLEVPEKNMAIMDYSQALSNQNRFVFFNSYTEGVTPSGEDIFAELVLVGAIFWAVTTRKGGADHEEASVYKTALAYVLARNYNKIYGTRNFDFKTLEVTNVANQGGGLYLMARAETSAFINLIGG